MPDPWISSKIIVAELCHVSSFVFIGVGNHSNEYKRRLIGGELGKIFFWDNHRVAGGERDFIGSQVLVGSETPPLFRSRLTFGLQRLKGRIEKVGPLLSSIVAARAVIAQQFNVVDDHERWGFTDVAERDIRINGISSTRWLIGKSQILNNNIGSLIFGEQTACDSGLPYPNADGAYGSYDEPTSKVGNLFVRFDLRTLELMLLILTCTFGCLFWVNYCGKNESVSIVREWVVSVTLFGFGQFFIYLLCERILQCK